MSRTRLILVIVFATLAAAPAAADAASVSGYGALRLDGRPGEANDVTITNTGTELVLRDSAPVVLSGEDCRQDDPHTVVCPYIGAYGEPRHVYVVLGDGDDRFAWHGPGMPLGPNGETTDVAGGAGDDVIAGTPGDDGLGGGEGSDRLAGGDGKDSIQGADGHDVVEGGPGDDYITGAEDVDAGAGTDLVDTPGGGHVRLRDGARDTLECAAPVASLEADMRTEIGWADEQDLVGACHPPGTGRAPVQLLSGERRFRITKRTKTIRLRFGCPATAKLVCETIDMSDVYSKACECGYEAPRFRIAPGDTLTVPFKPPKHDLRTLLWTLGWKHSLKGGIVWTSALDGTEVKKEGVWMRFVEGRRRR